MLVQLTEPRKRSWAEVAQHKALETNLQICLAWPHAPQLKQDSEDLRHVVLCIHKE